MKILIDIPKEFEQHFQTDRFEDSLHRLSADAHLIAGNYEQETAIMLIDAFKKAILVPNGRLIDADAAIANRNTDMNWCYDLYDLPDYLSGCPTIIPAEESNT